MKIKNPGGWLNSVAAITCTCTKFQIFEVFGPVGSPWYSLRFNSSKDIENKSVTCGQKVYCAPKVENLTNYVFVEHLRQ